MIPAFVGGFPGGMEVAVIFFILALLTAVAVVLLAGGRRLLGGGAAEPGGDLEARVADLEDEVTELRRRLDDRPDDH